MEATSGSSTGWGERVLGSSESSEEDEWKGGTRRTAEEADDAMRPRRRSRAVGRRAVARAMVANEEELRRSPWRW